MLPDWFCLLFVLSDLLRYQLHALVLESYQFDSKIACIIGNRNTGNIYVRTKGNMRMLDSALRIVSQQQCPVGTGDAENVTCNDLPKTFRRNCNVTGAFEPMQNAIQSAHYDPQASPSCTAGKAICTFIVDQDHFFRITVQNQTTQLWQGPNHIHNRSCTFVRTLRCELPDEVFPEATAGLFVRDSNISGSLFLTFVNTRTEAERMVQLSVTCQYRIDFNNLLENQTWTNPIASKPFPLHPRALLQMQFASRKALILVEPHDVIMQWLPVGERSSPQSILPNNFEYRIQRPMNVVDVILKENTTEVYVATDSMLRLINLDNCYPYPTCSQCLRSGDSFCGWCFSANRCTYRQLCPLDNKTQPEGWWLNSSKSEEQCHTHSSTTKSSQAKKTASKPKTLKPNNRSKQVSIAGNKEPLRNTPTSAVKPIDLVASQAVQMGIGVSLLLIVFLSGMIAAVSIRYRRVRRDNIQTVNRVKHRFPQCEGIQSYRQLRSICLLLGRPAAVQYRYRRQMQYSGDTEESTDSPLVT